LSHNLTYHISGQGQKLRNAQADLRQIDADLSEANRDLRGIHSVTGQMRNGLTSSKYEHIDRSKLTKEQRAELARKEKEEREKNEKKDKKGKKGDKKLTIEEILAQKKAEEDEARKKDTFQHLIESGQFDHLSGDAQLKMRETEQTIDAISGTVKDLKGMAVQMSNTLDEQNALIDELQTSATNANAKMKKTRAKVRREF
jgi:chromosome segregation ATPase